MMQRYNLPRVEIKDSNFIIDGKKFFDQPIENGKITSEKLLPVKEMITQLVVH